MHRVEFNECKWLFSWVFQGTRQNTQRYPGFCTSAKNSPIDNCLKVGIPLRKKHCNHVCFQWSDFQFFKCAADRSVLCATHNDMPRMWNSVRTWLSLRPLCHKPSAFYILVKYTRTSAALERRTRKKPGSHRSSKSPSLNMTLPETLRQLHERWRVGPVVVTSQWPWRLSVWRHHYAAPRNAGKGCQFNLDGVVSGLLLLKAMPMVWSACVVRACLRACVHACVRL